MVSPDKYDSNNQARTQARAALAPRPIGDVSSGWDRITTALRIVLPLLATGLALVMIILPFLSNNEASFTLSKEEVTEGDGRIRMKNLIYQGRDSKARLFTVRAAEGEQEDPSDNVISLSDVTAEVDIDPKTPLTVQAEQGLYRISNETMDLVQVRIITGNGYVLSMRSAKVDLKAQTAEGESDVSGRGPLGTVTADSLSLDMAKRISRFEGRVRVSVIPKRTKPKPPPSSAEEISS